MVTIKTGEEERISGNCGSCVYGLVTFFVLVWIIAHPIIFVTGIWDFMSLMFSYGF